MYSWICFHLIIPAAEPFTTVALQINVVKAEATVHIYASNTAIVHSFIEMLKIDGLISRIWPLINLLHENIRLKSKKTTNLNNRPTNNSFHL